MKKKGFIYVGMVLLITIIALIGCASYPMNGQFASNVPISEQSILTFESFSTDNGAFITSINGQKVVKDQRAGSQYFVIPPGTHQLTLGYSEVVSTNAFSVYMMGRGGMLEETVISSVNDFPVTFDFIAGRYYRVIGITDKDTKILPPNTIAYAIVDFTTKDLEVVWCSNDEVKDDMRGKQWGSIYSLNRGMIERAISSNKGYW